MFGVQEVIIVATDTERSSHKVYEKEQIGEVQIADEVVAIIAGLAATEVEGVDSLAGNMTPSERCSPFSISGTHIGQACPVTTISGKILFISIG